MSVNIYFKLYRYKKVCKFYALHLLKEAYKITQTNLNLLNKKAR